LETRNPELRTRNPELETRNLSGRLRPLAAIAAYQFVGARRAPGAGIVVREVAWRDRLPDVQNWGRDSPGFLDHIGTVEKSAVADHAVVEERFVAGIRKSLRQVAVTERHVHR